MNQTIEHANKWNDVYESYPYLENVLHREASSAVAIYSFGLQKTQIISGFIERKIVDFTQL